jgi:ribose/xylose/arabinose/galactoside ABC-type transport system permease subunit
MAGVDDSASGVEGRREREERRTRIALWLLDNMIWPILLVALVLFSLLLPRIFSTVTNVKFLFYSSAALGVLALAESLCLLSGNFDLSIGSIAGFSAMFTALFVTQWFPGVPAPVGIVLILVVGATIGALNGFSVAYLGVNPFLQTLAFFIIFRGSVTVMSTLAIGDLPPIYTYAGGGLLGPVRFAVPLVLSLYLVAWFVLRYTPFGLAIYATGGDEDSAAEAGIDTRRVVFLMFTLSGLLSGLAGLLLTGFVGAATPGLGDGSVFSAFAAAVIGGVSLFGGRGNVLGAFGGVLLLSALEIGLVQLQVDPEAIRAINGGVLLFAVLLYTFENRLRRRVLAA